jgi:uncharacterized membrane protein YgcG
MSYPSSSGEMEGWLKKKSPKTQGKKLMDVWQKRYFVLSGGELKYFKTEKSAHLSNADSLKAIRVADVRSAMGNPRHADMFVIDLGLEKKVKLQASTEQERDAWVAAIEAAKLKAWSRQEQEEYNEVLQGVRNSTPPTTSPAQGRPSERSSGGGGGGGGGSGGRSSGGASAAGSPQRSPDFRSAVSNQQAELLKNTPQHKQGCCVIS